MQLLNLARFVEELGLHLDFAIQHFHVSSDPFFVARHDLVAAAVVTERMAERDMDVE
jgi:hypothetical protein